MLGASLVAQPWVRKIPWRRDRLPTPVFLDLPGGSDGKESTCYTGDLGSIPGLGRSLGEGKGNPIQYSCLEKPVNRGAWWATVHGVIKSWTWLRNWHFISTKKWGVPRPASVETGKTAQWAVQLELSQLTAALNPQECHLHTVTLCPGSWPKPYQDIGPGLGGFWNLKLTELSSLLF